MRWYKMSASDVTERSQLMDEILEMIGTERSVQELRHLHQILKGMETPKVPPQSREPEITPQRPPTEPEKPLYEIGAGEDVVRTRQGPEKSRVPILPYERRYGPWTTEEVLEYASNPIDPSEFARRIPPTEDPRRDKSIQERWKKSPRGQQASKKEAFVPGPYKEDQNLILREFPEVLQEALDPNSAKPGVIPSPFASEKPGASDPKPVRPAIDPDLRVNPKSRQKGRLLRRRPPPDMEQTPKMPFGGGAATTRPAGDGHA